LKTPGTPLRGSKPAPRIRSDLVHDCRFSFLGGFYYKKRGLSIKNSTLPTLTFLNPFSARKQACGPEARVLRAKSIGGKRIPPRDPTVHPQNGAGPSGARQGVPTSESARSWAKNCLPARPKKRGVPYGFCAQHPCFRARQGLRLNRPPTSGKVKVARIPLGVFLFYPR
jgi:hypothetical protein